MRDSGEQVTATHGEAAATVMPAARTMTPTEEIVARVWAAELRLPHIGLDDDFIDLGSHSLQGVGIIARLEVLLGVSIPVRVLFEEPTVTDLAAWIDRQRGETEGPQAEIIRLQEGSGLLPLFAVPSGEGGPRALYAVAKLVREADPRRPLYGFPGDPPVPTRIPKEEWVEAAATSLNTALRLRQGVGPYLLLGHCVGGVIAWEMARQLEASGETVHLFLIDTRHPRLQKKAAHRSFGLANARRWARILLHRKVVIRVARRLQFEYLRARHKLRWESSSGNGMPKAGQQRMVLTGAHRPEPLRGRVKLLANANWHRADPMLGWGDRFADRMDVAVMQEEHGAWLDLHEAAVWLGARLEEADPCPPHPAPADRPSLPADVAGAFAFDP